MVSSLTSGAGHRNCPKNVRLSKPTDTTIHRKALEENSLMVPLVYRINHFSGGNAFSEFLPKTHQLKEDPNDEVERRYRKYKNVLV
jgi:hypothetical protein